MNEFTMNLYLKSEISIPLEISGFTESTTDTKTASFSSSSSLSVGAVSINSDEEVSFETENDFSVGLPTIEEVTYTLDATAESGDCTGRKKDSAFSSTDDALYVGYDSVSQRKSWIPFTVNFGSLTNGIHLISATLKLVAWDTQSLIDGSPCKIKAGIDTLINSTAPISWKTLNAKVMTNGASLSTLAQSWIEGQEYDIDITNSVKSLVGSDAITWNNGDKMSAILQDFGSSVGSYRTITSTEGNTDNPNYAAPVLELIYADNFCPDDVFDTWLSSTSPKQTNYNSTQILVGEPNRGTTYQRGLIAFNSELIPAGATITSATLSLYLESEKSSNNRTLRAYRMLSYWDVYGASWSNKFGTSAWTTAGGFSPTDCEQTDIGNIALSSSEAKGWKVITLTASKIQEWVDSIAPNRGLLLKMDTESNDGYVFSSSQSDTSVANHRPKFTIGYTLSGNPYTITIQN